MAAIRFVVVLAALMLSWPTVSGAWRGWFVQSAVEVTGRFSVSGEARFQPVEADGAAMDVEVVVFNRAHLNQPRVAATTYRVSSRYAGWIDVAFYLALVAATSGPARRLVPRALVGLALVQVGVWARLAIGVRYHAMVDPLLALPGPPAPLDAALRVLFESFVKDNLEAGMLLSLLIWASIVAPPELWASVLPERDEATGG